MIDELQVSNVALIRDAVMEPASGMTVITGETGAGKTALLSALKLLVGERADASMVREGSDALVVEGRIFGPDDPDGHVVRRRVSADGRGRVSLDGHMASVRELAEGPGATVDLCGQHEHQRLLSPAAHTELLDAFCGDDADRALAEYRAALAAARKAASELERVRDMGRAGAERLEEARFVLARIDEANPRAGELEELEATLPKAEHAEALIMAAEKGREAVCGDGGARDLLGEAVSALRAASAYDPDLAERADALQSALLDVEDVGEGLRDYRDSIDFDPASLDRMQSRMAQLQGLMRTYGPRMADVLDRRDRARELVEAAGDEGERERACSEELERAEAALAAVADRLDRVRMTGATGLAARVTEQMGRLEMGTAEVEVSVERLPREQWTGMGPSHVELLYRPAAGMAARPLRRIASGGETSRVMLACKVVLGEADKVDTLVFDEVDAGVGGATARALAQVLSDLSHTHQVIVVTHLAQVAVMGERHYVVRKTGADVPETTISEVVGQDRVVEVARLLSGDADEASLEHARALLAEQGR